MDTKEKQKLEKDLLGRKKHIEDQLAEIGRKKKEGDYEINFPDYDAMTSDELGREASDYERLKALERVLENDLQQINQTLIRLKQGQYGICHVCKKEIEPPRLHVMPTAMHCISCAKAKGL